VNQSSKRKTNTVLNLETIRESLNLKAVIDEKIELSNNQATDSSPEIILSFAENKQKIDHMILTMRQ